MMSHNHGARRRLLGFAGALFFPLSYLLIRFLVQQGCFWFLRIWEGGGTAGETAHNRALLRIEHLLPLLNLVCAALLLLGMGLLFKEDTRKLLRGAKTPLRLIPSLVLLGLSMNLLSSLSISLLSPLLPPIGKTGTVVGIAGLLYLVFAAPATEEILFRGFALNRLRGGFPLSAALCWQALLFGAFHLDLRQFLYTAPAGLILGLITLRRSLRAAILVHMAFNLCGVLPLPAPNAVWLRLLLLALSACVFVSAWKRSAA